MNCKNFRIITIILILTLFCQACGGGGKAIKPADPTNPPATPTYDVPIVVVTNTPVPPPTNTPLPPTATLVLPTPTPATPTLTPTPVVSLPKTAYVYTNGNHVRGITLLNGTLWAGTGGGAVAWNLTSGKATKYTTLDGLPTNDILAIVACPIPEPRIILGTEAGLTIHNPTTGTWEQMSPENSNMSKKDVNSLDCDPNNNTLMIGYTFGLDIFNAVTNQWKHLEQENGLATDWISKVAVIGKDTWVVSSFGVSVISSTGKIKAFTEKLGNIPDENVHGVAGDAKGNVWLAAFDGLMKYSKGTFKLYNSDNTQSFPFLDAFERVLVDPDGTVWAGNTFGSICQFDPVKEQCLNLYEDQKGMVGGLTDMVLDETGNLIYADDGEGISIYDGNSWRTFQLEELPKGNDYSTIAQILGGKIWAGGNWGLQQFSIYDADAKWEAIDLEGNYINTLFLVPEGVWVGHSAGASFYNYQSKSWTHLQTGKIGESIGEGSPTAITIDGRGRTWFGTSNGLTVYDGKTYTFYDLLSQKELDDKWSPRYVNTILFDGKNTWVGTSGALFRFDEKDQMTRWDDQLEGLMSLWAPTVNAFAMDRSGKVLIAIDNKLVTYDGTKFTELVEAPATIRSLLVTPKGEFWLGLDEGGVYYYNGSQWSSLSIPGGLPPNRFNRQGIVADDLGTIWFAGAEGGLVRYVPSVKTAHTAAPTESLKAEVRQWAVFARASSQYGETAWAANQATGAPDTLECGDNTSAWASENKDGVEWLELRYDKTVLPTMVNVYQTYNPSSVVKVELIDPAGKYHVIYTSTPEKKTTCPFILSIAVKDANYQAIGVKITIDQSKLMDWDEIDAVELVGTNP